MQHGSVIQALPASHIFTGHCPLMFLTDEATRGVAHLVFNLCCTQLPAQLKQKLTEEFVCRHAS